MIVLKKVGADWLVGPVIESQIVSFKPSEESVSNVEVTGDPLEAARDAGMFVI